MIKNKKNFLVTIAALSPALASMSCMSVSASDASYVQKANEEQVRINNLSHPTNEHLVLSQLSILDGRHFESPIVDKILEAVGITKNEDPNFGYRIFPQDIVAPTTTSGGSFKADIRTYYKDVVNESTQGVGFGSTKDNRVTVYYDYNLANALLSDTQVATKNIKGASYNDTPNATNVLVSTKTFAQSLSDANWDGTPKPTSPKTLNQAELTLLGLSALTPGNLNIFPKLSGNLMGTTVQYVLDREAMPKPTITIFVKKGFDTNLKTSSFKYSIDFASPTI